MSPNCRQQGAFLCFLGRDRTFPRYTLNINYLHITKELLSPNCRWGEDTKKPDFLFARKPGLK